LFVKVKAFQDGITVPEFYVVQKGRHYDSTCCTEGFEPDLNTYSDLNKSESTDGWLVFDVPSEHGTLHMKEFASERIQASWTF
jgi:hypothetical protein